MADTGARVPMRELVGKAGFRVWALDPTTYQLVPAAVSHAFSTGVKPVYKITTQLGRTIRATANHKFLTINGWARLDALRVGGRMALPLVKPEPIDISNGFGVDASSPSWTRRGGPTGRGGSIRAEEARPELAVALVDPLPPSGYSPLLKGESLSVPLMNPVPLFGPTELEETWAQGDVYWDRIVSIEPDGEEEVFDLTVPGPHNFIANDIIAHNSIEQDADVVMFIYRAERYGITVDENGNSTEGLAEIIIGKQRNGPIGNVSLAFVQQFARFENLTSYYGGGGDDMGMGDGFGGSPSAPIPPQPPIDNAPF